MSPSVILRVLLLIIFFFSIKLKADEDISRIPPVHCPPPTTCKNIKISHPFWRLDNYDGPVCGYPGLGIDCSNPDPEYPLLNIYGEYFLVKNISYTDHSITLVDFNYMNTAQESCPALPQNLTINETSPLVYNDAIDLKLTFYLNCASDDDLHYPGVYPIACFSTDEKTSYLNVGLADPYILERFKTCGETVVTAVKEEDEFRRPEWTWNISFIRKAMNKGFVLNWQTVEGCGRCEDSGGRCGRQDKYSGEALCFCNNGTVFHDQCPSKPKGLAVGLKIIIGMSGVAFSAVVISVCCFANHRAKNRHAPKNNHGIFGKPLQKKKENEFVEVFMEQYGSLAPRVYSFSDIKKMTSSFKHKLGQGGYGEVYKGTLCDGRPVAVKILNSTKATNNNNGEEFINEVASISRTSHINVVTLLGFCYRNTKRALVYEFMPNGSLERYIHSKNEIHLGWDKLCEIALGIAQGLEYLHKGCNTRIVHFDIKPHNILLDQDFCPKISDFGLAKLCNNNESILSMLGARGTVGYIAPEVVSRNFGSVSNKSDVYSYGMMVLEMVGGRKNVTENVSCSSEIYFPHWAYKRLLLDEDLKLQEIITEEEQEIAKKMILVGFWCIQTDPSDRPSMNKVIEMLVGNLDKLQIPPKPFLYSSSYSEGISSTISPVMPLCSSSCSLTL